MPTHDPITAPCSGGAHPEFLTRRRVSLRCEREGRLPPSRRTLAASTLGGPLPRTFRLVNDSAKAFTVSVEPWAWEHAVQPGEAIRLVVYAGELDQQDEGDGHITLWVEPNEERHASVRLTTDDGKVIWEG